MSGVRGGSEVTQEVQGNLNIRDYSDRGNDGNLLVEGNLTVGGSIIPSQTGTGSIGLAPSGDTTGATDSAAIQNLINLTGIATLGPGLFFINATINPTAGVTVIQGSGWKTIIAFDGAVVSPAIGMGDTTQRTVFIRDLRLRQNNASSHVGVGINGDYFTAQSVIERITIDGNTKQANIGIEFGVVSNNTHYTRVSNCKIVVNGSNAVGLAYLGGSNGAISNVADNIRVLCDGSDATQTGILVSSRTILLIHPDIENIAGTAISITAGALAQGDACTIVNPYLEGNGTNISIASGVLSTTVVGGTILQAAGGGGITDAGTATKIFGVRFVNSSNLGGIVYDQMILQSDAASGRIVRVTNTHATTPADAALRVDSKAAGDPAVGVRITGDGASRLVVAASGQIAWGDGTNALDLHLSRQAAGILANDGVLYLANNSQPATPSGGGILFVSGGALKYIGSSGTVTPIANA